MKTTSRLRRRITTTTLIAILTAGAIGVTGCIGTGAGPSPEGGDEQFSGEVEFWTVNLKKNFNDYIQAMIDSYEEQHPDVEITWVDVPGEEVATKLLAATASGDVPDAVNLPSDAVGRFIPQLAKIDGLLDDEALDQYVPTLVDPMRFEGDLYALPWYNGGPSIMLYRSSMLSKVGFDPASPPETMADALTLAQDVYDETGVHGTNLMPSYLPDAVLVYEGIPLLNDERTEAAFNTDEAVEVLERYKAAYDVGGIAPGAVKFNANAYTENLENGKLAFIPSTGAWMVESLEANAPDVYADLGVAAAPRTEDGTFLLLGQQTFVIPQQSTHQRAAAEFIKYVTNAENQLAFAKIVPIYPSAVEAVSDPFFTSVEGTGIQADIRAAIADALPDMQYYELGSRDDTALSDALNRQIERFILGQVTAQEALDQAEMEWNDLLAVK